MQKMKKKPQTIKSDAPGLPVSLHLSATALLHLDASR